MKKVLEKLSKEKFPKLKFVQNDLYERIN